MFAASLLDGIIGRGFYVVRHGDETSDAGLLLEDIKDTISVISKKEWKQLYEYPDGPMRESPAILGRTRVLLDPLLAMKLSSTLAKDWQCMYPTSAAHTWTVETGPDAFAHRDFPVDGGKVYSNRVNVPAAVVVALRDMTVSMYGWNRLVVEPKELERHDLKSGDVFIYRGSMIYQIEQEASLYLHAFLEPIEAAKSSIITNMMDPVPMLVKAELASTVVCPLASCTYSPRAEVTLNNLVKHLSREHKIRRSNPPRSASRGGVAISDLLGCE